MTNLDRVARRRTALDPADLAWLEALVDDWQVIADLAFADLLLWVPDAESVGEWWAAAQVRPATGPTTLLEDVAGTSIHDAARTEACVVDVRRAGRVLGQVEVRAAAGAERSASALESAYRASADDLLRMVAAGEFPAAPSTETNPLRVGEGFVRLSSTGAVEYASPNAQSAFRRLGWTGDLTGVDLADVTTSLLDSRPTDRGPGGLLRSGRAGEAEIEGADVRVALRVIPLRRDGVRVGALALLRDVTELRRRERQLVSKEATIREIHHRVKNNLQTVAALLRLQGRRMEAPAARAALDDAVRRVGSIALVHEILSQSFDEEVDFDDVADRLLRSILDVVGRTVGDSPRGAVTGKRIGSFGSVPADVATALAMVLAELVQNAAQHAYPETGGRLTVAANRIRERLRVRVSDDGVGMPAGAGQGETLGLSIVRTLVESELDGTIDIDSTLGRGTTVTLTLEV